MNLPNKISLTRICMIPVFVIVFFLNFIPYRFAIAGAIFTIAACTDFIDGYIARSRGLVTNLGKFLDPIADKVLIATAMILLLTMKDTLFSVFGGAVDVAYVATTVCVCIIMARELIISAFRQIGAANGMIMAAEKLGKYKAAVQDVSIVVLLVATDIPATAGAVIAYVGFGLFAIATVLTVISGVTYVVKYKHVLSDKQED